MTVSELIELLKTLPPDALVVTRGYEGGYCDVVGADKLSLVLNYNTAWYYGPHETLDKVLMDQQIVDGVSDLSLVEAKECFCL